MGGTEVAYGAGEAVRLRLRQTPYCPGHLPTPLAERERLSTDIVYDGTVCGTDLARWHETRTDLAHSGTRLGIETAHAVRSAVLRQRMVRVSWY
eukprot:3608836-Rhodomonas_salina.1